MKKIKIFFLKEDSNYEWISFFRISIGIVLLLHFISVLPDFNALFSTKGIISSDILDVFIPNFIVTFPKIIVFFSSFGISEIITTFFFKITYIIFCIFLILGFSPRISASILLFLQISLIKGSSFYIYGADYFSSMSLFYLILIPSHYNHSIYIYFKRKIIISNITPFKRLFQIHLSIAYFFSGFTKILGFNWRNGESIWKAINLPFFNNDFHFNFSFLAHNSILLIIIGWSIILIEIMYPIFIWKPKTRKTWLYFTIFMHLGIALVFNLYIFSAIMIIWNLTNFYFENEQK
jgi:hypothetical protein